MIERLAAVIVIAMIIAVAVVASSRKFGLHRPQKALLETLSEHDPRCIGDGAVREGWKSGQARYPNLPNYRAGRA